MPPHPHPRRSAASHEIYQNLTEQTPPAPPPPPLSAPPALTHLQQAPVISERHLGLPCRKRAAPVRSLSRSLCEQCQSGQQRRSRNAPSLVETKGSPGPSRTGRQRGRRGSRRWTLPSRAPASAHRSQRRHAGIKCRTRTRGSPGQREVAITYRGGAHPARRLSAASTCLRLPPASSPALRRKSQSGRVRLTFLWNSTALAD